MDSFFSWLTASVQTIQCYPKLTVSQSESVQILTQMAEILLNNLLTESHKPNTWYMTLPRMNWRLLWLTQTQYVAILSLVFHSCFKAGSLK